MCISLPDLVGGGDGGAGGEQVDQSKEYGASTRQEPNSGIQRSHHFDLRISHAAMNLDSKLISS